MSAGNPTFAGALGLSPAEVRVLGCLLEKQLTTPDIYPLTLNGLRLACNQSTNRDPVVDYDDATLREALHRLERRGLVRMASGRGSRAPKYRHLLAQALPLTPDEHAVLCVLMLRGPETPGELKQRAGRMHTFTGLDAVHETLERLAARRLIARLDRRPGQKEERYVQLLEDLDSQEAERDLERMPAPDAGAAWAAGKPDAAEQASRDGSTAAGGDLSAASPGVAPAGPPGAGPAASPHYGPGAPPDTGPAASPDVLATLAGLGERLAQVEREVAELRAAVATAPPAGLQPTSPRPHPDPEPAAQERRGEEWA
jgi:uncharacterized protein